MKEIRIVPTTRPSLPRTPKDARTATPRFGFVAAHLSPLARRSYLPLPPPPFVAWGRATRVHLYRRDIHSDCRWRRERRSDEKKNKTKATRDGEGGCLSTTASRLPVQLPSAGRLGPPAAVSRESPSISAASVRSNALDLRRQPRRRPERSLLHALARAASHRLSPLLLLSRRHMQRRWWRHDYSQSAAAAAAAVNRPPPT